MNTISKESVVNNPEKPSPTNPSRRNVLAIAAAGIGTLVLSSFLYPIVKFITPPKKKINLVSSAIVAADTDIPINSGKIVSFNGEILLIVNKDGELTAMSAVCTHLGCTVQWLKKEQLVWCACHNARYDEKGEMISGPQPRSLEPYVVKIQDGNVIVYKNQT